MTIRAGQVYVADENSGGGRGRGVGRPPTFWMPISQNSAGELADSGEWECLWFGPKHQGRMVVPLVTWLRAGIDLRLLNDVD